MSWSNDDYKDVIGQAVQSVELVDDGGAVLFTLTNGEQLAYQAEGDCCSSSWVEHITVPPDVAGATITSVKDDYGVDATSEQEAESRAKGEYIDCLTVYQVAFATTKGEIIVEFRNNSNGYYGGWLSGPYRKN